MSADRWKRADAEARLGPLTDEEADALRFARRAWLRDGTEAGWLAAERMTLAWFRCFGTIHAPATT